MNKNFPSQIYKKSFTSGKNIFYLTKSTPFNHSRIFWTAEPSQALGCTFLSAFTLIQSSTEKMLPPRPFTCAKTTTPTKHQFRALLLRESYWNVLLSQEDEAQKCKKSTRTKQVILLFLPNVLSTVLYFHCFIPSFNSPSTNLTQLPLEVRKSMFSYFSTHLRFL